MQFLGKTPAGEHRGSRLGKGDGGPRQKVSACKDLSACVETAADLSRGRSGEERQADAGVLKLRQEVKYISHFPLYFSDFGVRGSDCGVSRKARP